MINIGDLLIDADDGEYKSIILTIYEYDNDAKWYRVCGYSLFYKRVWDFHFYMCDMYNVIKY
jgi:hypothetical protein